MFAAEEAVVANPWIYDNVWLIPALPAVSFFLILFFGKRLPQKGSEIGLVAVAGSFLLALLATFTWITDINSVGDEALGGGETIALEADGVSESVVLTAEEEGEEPARGGPVINELEWFGIGTDANQVTLGDLDGAEAEGAEESSRFSISCLLYTSPSPRDS